MDDNPAKSPRRGLAQGFTGPAINFPPGHRPKGKRLEVLEREAAQRKRLLIGAAIAAALVVGVLIGRFLIP
jgi:hypothetical protein